ncbi:hypothetical protein BO85DRAFT_148863 [Aspergillus piperis CBS 112811]|uniref:Uncharacterized protein n=1 Tax=Aspergillus piperis CBS 112811 TaxID=1448313 RepID=A0A8G1QTH0_9EURO|nr:hypothetical protein BO85DRAFT_148863 [Aspergillus piperis CBS 112811]RAH53981.1 hypothetical protein BO85DRAFT_148863 [Aspergillus piperis CBS 112811]
MPMPFISPDTLRGINLVLLLFAFRSSLRKAVTTSYRLCTLFSSDALRLVYAYVSASWGVCGLMNYCRCTLARMRLMLSQCIY